MATLTQAGLKTLKVARVVVGGSLSGRRPLLKGLAAEIGGILVKAGGVPVAESQAVNEQEAVNARFLDAIFSELHIADGDRSLQTLLASVINTKRRADCLTGIEREFFSFELLDPENPGTPTFACPLDRHASPAEYVSQFSGVIANLIAAPSEVSVAEKPAGEGLASEAHALVADWQSVQEQAHANLAEAAEDQATDIATKSEGDAVAETPAAIEPSAEVVVSKAMRGWIDHLSRGRHITRQTGSATGPFHTDGRDGLTAVMVKKLEDAGLVTWEGCEGSAHSEHAVLTDTARAVASQTKK